MRPFHAAIALGLALASAGCGHRAQTFESHAKVLRFDVIRRDEHGTPRTADLEIEWTECPGEQREVQRVDAKFIACFEKHKIDETLPVRVLWTDEGGQLDWDVTQFGDCARNPEPDDDVSFDMVHECVTEHEQGETIGFHCVRDPSGELLSKCPWFRRR